ncbi:MAG: ABC transporter substrate-binding protein [Thermodesulfobacteriota bacterium]|jgi:phospholipid transport system substrate-binding protein
MKLKIFLTILFCLISLGFQNMRSHAETPAARVQGMLEQVMAIQTDPQLQGPAFREERRTAIKKIIARNFDFEAMARQALGPYWEKLNDAERVEFKALFQDLFQGSYTKLVLDFLKREKVLYNKEELHQGKALIQTTLIRVNEEIPVDYSLTFVQEQWLVDDVTIDGVSIVRNYQRAFTRVIQRESYKSLLQKMRLQKQAIETPS